MAIQSIQQARAKYALEQVEVAAKKLGKEQKKEYVSYAASLPAMIHMNGLGQAAAFYKSKGDRHGMLYELLSNWLCGVGRPYGGSAFKAEGLVKVITESDMKTYKLAQAEAQALMDWVKKFAKAYMKEAK